MAKDQAGLEALKRGMLVMTMPILLAAMTGQVVATSRQDADSARAAPVERSSERLQVAGRAGSAVAGAAAGARALRERGGREDEKSSDAGSAPNAAAQGATDGQNSSGPFKLPITPLPGTSPEVVTTPPPAAAITSTPGLKGVPSAKQLNKTNAKPAADGADHRAPMPASGQQGQDAKSGTAATPQAAAPVIPAPLATSESQDTSCIAGCYTTTAARASNPLPLKPERPSRVQQPPSSAIGSAQSAASEVECIAGCDRTMATPVRRAEPNDAAAGSAGVGSPDKSAGRITVLRGVSRTRTYGVSQ